MGPAFVDIANGLYRAKIDHISVSELKLFNYMPYLYKHQYIDKAKKKQTDSQGLGTLFHLALLEPDEFHKVLPFKDLRTSAAIKAKAEGILTCKQSDYDNVVAAKAEVLKNPAVAAMLDACKKEASVFWKWPGLDLLCKCRFDAVNVDEAVIFDVKTCQSIGKFKQQIDWYGYDLQAAFYTTCASLLYPDKKWKFQFLVVEMEDPYLYKVFEVSDVLMVDATDRLTDMLHDFKKARDSNHFPHPSEEIEMLFPKTRSNYMYQEIQEVIK